MASQTAACEVSAASEILENIVKTVSASKTTVLYCKQIGFVSNGMKLIYLQYLLISAAAELAAEKTAEKRTCSVS